jgi:hypothetical protein
MQHGGCSTARHRFDKFSGMPVIPYMSPELIACLTKEVEVEAKPKAFALPPLKKRERKPKRVLLERIYARHSKSLATASSLLMRWFL